jgi:hypothetical protein
MKNLKELAKQFPNDEDLGREIRNLVNTIDKPVVFIHGKYKHISNKNKNLNHATDSKNFGS